MTQTSVFINEYSIYAAFSLIKVINKQLKYITSSEVILPSSGQPFHRVRCIGRGAGWARCLWQTWWTMWTTSAKTSPKTRLWRNIRCGWPSLTSSTTCSATQTATSPSREISMGNPSAHPGRWKVDYTTMTLMKVVISCPRSKWVELPVVMN